MELLSNEYLDKNDFAFPLLSNFFCESFLAVSPSLDLDLIAGNIVFESMECVMGTTSLEYISLPFIADFALSLIGSSVFAYEVIEGIRPLTISLLRYLSGYYGFVF